MTCNQKWDGRCQKTFPVLFRHEVSAIDFGAEEFMGPGPP
jgi:hypothetical protein